METKHAEEARTETAQRVAAHAQELHDAMERLGLERLSIAGLGCLRRGRYRSNVGTAAYLIHETGEDVSGNLLEGTVGENDGSSGYYLHGDFSTWVKYPTWVELTVFAEDLAAITEALSAAINGIERDAKQISQRLEESPVPEITA